MIESIRAYSLSDNSGLMASSGNAHKLQRIYLIQIDKNLYAQRLNTPIRISILTMQLAMHKFVATEH